MVELKQEIDSFNEEIKKMEDEYINLPCQEYDAVSSTIGCRGKKSKMVGLSDQFQEIQTWLLDPTGPCYHTLVGMAGIGKTTLATQLFEDPLIVSHFDCRAFVTVGQKYRLKDILIGILAQVNPEIDKTRKLDDLKKMIYQNLKGKTYLVVLDDVWTTQVWNDLRRRCLLSGLCPSHLEKAGKKIAENCEGLPLLIITVANILSEADKTPEYWRKAADRDNSVFMDANDQIMSKVLFSSYEYLPQHLKACFLYMGIFPQNYEITRSKLINLWSAEGFLEHSAMQCLEELVTKSLVMVHKKSLHSPYRSPIHQIKTCGLHSVFWHLCSKEAEKNNFFHVVNGIAEAVEHERRLCVHKNIHFVINKEVYKSIASVSRTRSLLCFGPYHKYPVPISLEYLRLLRVFDALTIRMYEFPMEILKLVQLRYLALTYDGNIPSSISKLRNLQFLIILRHLSIINSCKDLSYLPIEIWEMQELKHLQITGSNLPDPCGALLPNLVTLLDVSPRCCTKELLERIPLLSKLRIRFDLSVDANESSNHLLDFISRVSLSSLKCVVLNPIPRCEFVVLPQAPIVTNFDSRVVKLSLSGFGYPWEDMSTISSMWSLQVLKLRRYAFRGPKWETRDRAFKSLKVLVIEDSDLMQWTVGIKTFRCLEHLTMRRCHRLEMIPSSFGEIFGLSIKLVDRNPLVVACAQEMDGKRKRKFLSVSTSIHR
ncbi:PREDICTED: putative late blight resistance protein homolog R1A-10 [Erythranthe guttata]|uniref:putative late blight resistance protein homolog R1A-10 n=1 Tax=Erythranthe guttata TaxID=4155 RepID=UPI00064E0E2C|nr:PREDICTED: putative late blight resistance protein homolog R1A-10 [Erythranthe guttata]|eukprot:XP_012853771.1 PREDICTED: putative late blight resistance protein homolog R1A-10 [Erythranthe guttata]